MMDSHSITARGKSCVRLPSFDGFPYFVTRVVPTMYHIILLPKDLSSEEAEMLVRRQVEANHLPTCLVVASDRALYVAPDGSAVWSDSIPCGGIIVADRLQPCRRFAKTRELAQRCACLDALLSAQPREGYMFGDLTKGGRKPTFDESVLLAGTQPSGMPRGLALCPSCREWRGRCLDPAPQFTGQVMDVHCRCDNDNRCAACGLRLYERKLNANYYDARDGHIWHVPGFSAFGHTCRSFNGHSPRSRLIERTPKAFGHRSTSSIVGEVLRVRKTINEGF